jgi:hypothetical protein
MRPLGSVWTFGDHPGSQTEVRIKQDFTSVPESSWLWRKLHQKVSAWGWGMLYWPACWVAYKRKSWRAGFQSAASDGQRHTPCGHNLNYTIWTLYAESVSSHQVPFTPGCSSFTQGHTLLPGACPFQSIKQLWARPDQQRHPLFNPPRQTETHPLPPVKRNQETRDTHLPFQKQQWRPILACLARIPVSVEVSECFPAYLPCQKQQWRPILACQARNPVTVEVSEYSLPTFSRRKKLNKNTHTSVALVSCMSSLKLRHWRGCVVVDRSPQAQVPGAHLLLQQQVLGALLFPKEEHQAPTLSRLPF